MKKFSYSFTALFVASIAVGAEAPRGNEEVDYSEGNTYAKSPGNHTSNEDTSEGFFRSGAFISDEPLDTTQKTLRNGAHIIGEGAVGAWLMSMWHSDIMKKKAAAQLAATEARAAMKNSLKDIGMSAPLLQSFEANASEIDSLRGRIAVIEESLAAGEMAESVELAKLKQLTEAHEKLTQLAPSEIAAAKAPTLTEHSAAELQAAGGAETRQSYEKTLADLEKRIADQRAIVEGKVSKKSLSHVQVLRKQLDAAQVVRERFILTATSNLTQDAAAIEQLAQLRARASQTATELAEVSARADAIASRGLFKKFGVGLVKVAADAYIVADVASKTTTWVKTGELVKPFNAVDLAREGIRRTRSN